MSMSTASTGVLQVLPVKSLAAAVSGTTVAAVAALPSVMGQPVQSRLQTTGHDFEQCLVQSSASQTTSCNNFQQFKLFTEELTKDIPSSSFASIVENFVKIFEIKQQKTYADEKRFECLFEQWQSETMFVSSVTDIIMNDSYLGIIGMGKDALPFIFASMKTELNFWFPALRAITQANPVPETHRGDMKAMTDDWLKWAREHHYDC